MKITQDVRDYAAQIGVDEQAALAAGMKEKAEEFKQTGAKIYHEVGSSGSRRDSESGAAGRAKRLIAIRISLFSSTGRPEAASCILAAEH